VAFVLIRSNVAFTIGSMAQQTVVGLLGIRHQVTGWTADSRGRRLELTACGRQILLAVQESDDTVNCSLCFAETGKPTRKKKR
jgi:hypothetical protein